MSDTIDTAKLRALAEAAAVWPWDVGLDSDDPDARASVTVAYLAALHPAAVLALLDRLAEAEARAEIAEAELASRQEHDAVQGPFGGGACADGGVSLVASAKDGAR